MSTGADGGHVDTDAVTVVDVGVHDAGDRLDVVLARALGESRSQAAGRIDRGEVTVDGHRVVRSHRVRHRSRIAVAAQAPRPDGGAGVPVPPVRWEDAHLMVLAKPAGLVVHPGHGHPSGTLVQALADAGVPLAPAGGERRPGIVHRLDKGTSGLLVVAKTDAAHRGLVGALARHDVERRYLAVVDGTLPAARGRVEVPLGRDPRDRTRFAAVADGKRAVTRFEVVATGGVTVAGGAVAVSRVHCRLETGRTHQVRVHLAHAGAPVSGDRTYGARRDVAAALGLDRPALHAWRLCFVHPVTGAIVDVVEPPPADLGGALERAGLHTGA